MKHLLVASTFLLYLVCSCAGSGQSATPTETITTTSPDWAIPAITDITGPADSFFSPTSVGEAIIRFSLAEWNSLLNDYDKNPRNETFREVSVEIKGPGIQGTAQFASAGFRLRGNTSRVRPEGGDGRRAEATAHTARSVLNRFHFKLKFNEKFDGAEDIYGPPSREIPTRDENKGQELFPGEDKVPGVRALNFKFNKDDPSYVRQQMANDLFRAFGVHAPRGTYMRVTLVIGGEAPRYLGVYSVFEDVDQGFLQRRFAGQKGTLFKNLWQQFGPADLSQPDNDNNMAAGPMGQEITDPSSRADFEDGFTQYRPSYDLKEDPKGTGAQDLNALMTLLRGNPTMEQLATAIDVQSLLRAMAVNVMIGQADDYWRGGNNYYLFTNPVDGRWTFLPYDGDRSFGIGTFGPDPATSSVLGWGRNTGVQTNAVLMRRVLDHPQYLADFKAYLREFVRSGIYTENAVLARMTAMQNAIAPWLQNYQVANDRNPFNDERAYFKAFVLSRIGIMVEETKP